MAGSAHLAGVEEHCSNGVKARIYSPAKTVVDCFKHRNKIGLDGAGGLERRMEDAQGVR